MNHIESLVGKLEQVAAELDTWSRELEAKVRSTKR